MNKYTQAIAAISFLTIILAAGYNYCNYEPDAKAKRPVNKKKDIFTVILETFENQDYTQWRALVEDRGLIGEVVAKEDFDKFVKARELARSGRYEQAYGMASLLQRDIILKMDSARTPA